MNALVKNVRAVAMTTVLAIAPALSHAGEVIINPGPNKHETVVFELDLTVDKKYSNGVRNSLNVQYLNTDRNQYVSWVKCEYWETPPVAWMNSTGYGSLISFEPNNVKVGDKIRGRCITEKSLALNGDMYIQIGAYDMTLTGSIRVEVGVNSYALPLGPWSGDGSGKPYAFATKLGPVKMPSKNKNWVGAVRYPEFIQILRGATVDVVRYECKEGVCAPLSVDVKCTGTACQYVSLPFTSAGILKSGETFTITGRENMPAGRQSGELNVVVTAY